MGGDSGGWSSAQSELLQVQVLFPFLSPWGHARAPTSPPALRRRRFFSTPPLLTASAAAGSAFCLPNCRRCCSSRAKRSAMVAGCLGSTGASCTTRLAPLPPAAALPPLAAVAGACCCRFVFCRCCCFAPGAEAAAAEAPPLLLPLPLRPIKFFGCWLAAVQGGCCELGWTARMQSRSDQAKQAKPV